MELPPELLSIIKEYSMPLSRPDWRQGCYANRLYDGYYYNFKQTIRIMIQLIDYRYNTYQVDLFEIVL
jgi:hypothetical protein